MHTHCTRTAHALHTHCTRIAHALHTHCTHNGMHTSSDLRAIERCGHVADASPQEELEHAERVLGQHGAARGELELEDASGWSKAVTSAAWGVAPERRRRFPLASTRRRRSSRVYGAALTKAGGFLERRVVAWAAASKGPLDPADRTRHRGRNCHCRWRRNKRSHASARRTTWMVKGSEIDDGGQAPKSHHGLSLDSKRRGFCPWLLRQGLLRARVAAGRGTSALLRRMNCLSSLIASSNSSTRVYLASSFCYV